eukprot:4235050-Pyramimonas_sp.AAC.1
MHGPPSRWACADLVVLWVDASGAPLSSYPRWLLRYLVMGAVRPSRGSTPALPLPRWGGA